jgi:ferritin-like metal-binding protein YciE
MVAINPTPTLASLILGLQNVHAVENQALALIDRQLDRLENYPDLAARLRLHRQETENQVVRVEDALGFFDESPSRLKDTALSIGGNLAALGHTIAGDEILKNSFANLAFENYEVASYISLITMAEVSGNPNLIPALRTSLSEEQSMATWVQDNLPAITRRYLELEEAGARSSR